jgi:hypothetical protein
MDVIKVKGIALDDFTLNLVDTAKEGLSYGWSQVCDKHAKLFPAKMLDNVGSGICGVEGCKEEAEHYLDFEKNDVKKINGGEHGKK